MKLMMLLLIVVFAATVCESIPFLPDEFEAVITENLLHVNRTRELHQYYDKLNNRLRIESTENNQSNILIYHFNFDAVFDIVGSECHAHNLTEEPQYGGFYEDNSHHLVSASSLYGESKDFNYQYIGVHRAGGGILCDAWTAEAVNQQGFNGDTYSYNVTWYWSIPGWIFPITHNLPVPVRSVYEGVWRRSNGQETPFHVVYEWTRFVPDRPDHWWFEIPDWTFCPHLHNIPIPQLPDDFSSTIEANFQEGNFTIEIREYYDADADKAAIATHRNDHIDYQIYDYGQQRHWNISHGRHNFHCIVTNTSMESRGVNGPATGQHLKTVKEFFDLGSAYNFSYGGHTRVRGILCQQWQGFVDETFPNGRAKYTLRWYFAVPNWTFRGEDPKGYQRPIRLIVNGTFTLNGKDFNFHHNYDFIDYLVGDPPSFYFQPPSWLFCPDIVQKPMPTRLPSDYTINIEVVEPNRNLTFNLKEYHDLDANRARFETCYENFESYEIYDIDSLRHYTIYNNSNCIVRDIHERNGFIGGGLETLVYNESDHRLARDTLGAAKWAQYGGTTVVRGMKVDWFRNNITDRIGSNIVRGHQDWFFVVREWNECDHDKVHSAARLIQSVVNASIINTTGHFVRNLYRVFDYSGGRVGQPDGAVFDPPPVCHGKYTPVDCSQISARDCDGFNRLPCGTTNAPNMCGPCKSGHRGLSGPGLSFCFERGRLLPTDQNIPIPDFPSDDFSTTIEVNMLERSRTVNLREHYDYTGNRVRIESRSRGQSVIEIHNFDTQNLFRITDGNVCTTTNTSDRGSVGFDSNTGHLRRSDELFDLTSNYTYSYGGMDLARGILTRYWFTFIREANVLDPTTGIDFVLVWHFANGSWHVRGERNHGNIPVRLVLNGTTWKMENNVRVPQNNFFHIYDFIDFELTRPPRSLFFPDRFVFCQHLPSQPFPAISPDEFEVTIEEDNPRTRSTNLLRQFFDYNKNKVRFDYYRTVRETQIFDLNTLRMYDITGSDCSVTILPATNTNGGRFGIPWGGANHHLLHPENDRAKSAVYGGFYLERDIFAERWRYTDYLRSPGVYTVNYTAIWVFASSNWRFEAFNYSGESTHVPLRVDFSGFYIDETKPNPNPQFFLASYTYTGIIVHDIPERIFDIPAACFGKSPDVTCNGLTEADCVVLRRQPCGVTNDNDKCGPCQAGFAPSDGRDGGIAANVQCYPIGAGPVTLNQNNGGVETGVTVGTAIATFFVGIAVGLLIYFGIVKARQGFQKLRDTNRDAPEEGSAPHYPASSNLGDEEEPQYNETEMSEQL